MKFKTMFRFVATRYAAAVLSLFLVELASAQFTTVINVPPDVAPNSIGSFTQLNLFNGGVLTGGFEAGTPGTTNTSVEVNIHGGSVGDSFRANNGSTINISGGTIGFNSNANSGSIVNITGGGVLGFLRARSGSV